MILNTLFCQHVKEILEAESISQAELARRMEVKPQMVSQYLRGEVCPGLDVVERFAIALGVHPSTLLSPNEIYQEIN